MGAERYGENVPEAAPAGLAAQKQRMRRRMRELRGALSEEERERLSWLLCRRVGAFLCLLGAKRIAAYAAVRGEADLSRLWEPRPLRGWTFCFPRADGDRIMFRSVDPLRGLLPGAYGIPAPSPDAPEIVPSELDVVLTPGLAFDLHGARLGSGRGYYDRFFEAARPRPLVVGIGFALQLQWGLALPVEPWDGRMDWVVTDREVVRCLPRLHTRRS